MYDLSSVLSAAEARLSLISRLEQETNELLLAPIDTLAACLERRQAALESYIEADALLKELCSDSDELKEVLSLKCDFESIPYELKPLLTLLMSERASINRILNLEPHIAARLEHEKASILSKIENLNASTIVAANKYYRAFNPSVGHNAMVDSNKTI